MRQDESSAPNQGPEGDQADGSPDDRTEVVVMARGAELWRLEWKRLLVEVRWMELVVRHNSEQAELQQDQLTRTNSLK